MNEMSEDIRTATLLKLAEHMKNVNKTLTELNKEVEEMMQDIMRDLRRESIVEKYIEESE